MPTAKLDVDGALDVSGNATIGGVATYEDVTNVDSVGIVTARSGVSVPDGQKILLGTSNDLQIYHDGNNSYIDDTGTGRLNIRGNTGVSLRNYSNSNQFNNCYTDGAVELFHNNSKKFRTVTGGISVTGDITCSQHIDLGDSQELRLGASDDLKIYHDGSHSYITNGGSGNLYIDGDTDDLVLQAGDDVRIQTQGNENAINCVGNGAVEIYYDNSRKFGTTSTGVSITGAGTFSSSITAQNTILANRTGSTQTAFLSNIIWCN